MLKSSKKLNYINYYLKIFVVRPIQKFDPYVCAKKFIFPTVVTKGSCSPKL